MGILPATVSEEAPELSDGGRGEGSDGKGEAARTVLLLGGPKAGEKKMLHRTEGQQGEMRVEWELLRKKKRKGEIERGRGRRRERERDGCSEIQQGSLVGALERKEDARMGHARPG